MKIIITGTSSINKIELGKKIISKDDELTITPMFTSDELYKGKYSDKYIYYLDPNIINLSYKNNAFLYISTEDYITSGITIDDFYNNDIVCISTKNFNKIIDSIFTNNECLIIWVDSKYHNNINLKEELVETKYLEENLSKLNYLYFVDEDFGKISEVIIDYITSDENRKKELLEEYC